MWGKLFKGGDDKGGDRGARDEQRRKQKEHDAADALRDVFSDRRYMAKLEDITASGPYSRLKGLLERLETAGKRAEPGEEGQLSDATVISLARQLEESLKAIGNPNPRLKLEVSDSIDGPFREFDEADAAGLRMSDYRRMARELREPLLRPLSVAPPPKGGLPPK